MASGSESQGGPAGPGGGPNRPSTGGTNVGQAPGPFTWNGAKPAGTFDPKNFGTRLFQDLNTSYGQGPKINPISPFTDYGQQTKDLIGGGLNTLSPVANGSWLNGGNPYFADSLRQTRENTTDGVNRAFASDGTWGSNIHAEGLARGLADSENNARMQNFDTEYNRMLGAQGQGLALSGLLDSKAAEKTAADSTMWDRNNNGNFNHLAQYLGLLNGAGGADAPTNKPVSFWDILGGIGSTVGSFL
jgi:hypothetical protein